MHSSMLTVIGRKRIFKFVDYNFKFNMNLIKYIRLFYNMLSLKCTEECLCCDKRQVAKINYAGYHGLCDDHLVAPYQQIRCIKCESDVEVLIHKRMLNCCSGCNLESNCSLHTCENYICDNCKSFSGECPVCCPVDNRFEKDTPIEHSSKRIKKTLIPRQLLFPQDQIQRYKSIKASHDIRHKDLPSRIDRNEVKDFGQGFTKIQAYECEGILDYSGLMHMKSHCEVALIISKPSRETNRSNRLCDFFQSIFSFRICGC